MIPKQPSIPRCPYPSLDCKDFEKGKLIGNTNELPESKADYFYVCNELETGPSVRSRAEIFSMPFCNVCSYFKWNSHFTIYEAAKKQKGWIPVGYPNLPPFGAGYEYGRCPFCGVVEGVGAHWKYCPHCGKRVGDSE